MILGLILALLLDQYIPAGPVFSHSGGCTPPVSIEVSQWPHYGTGVTCTSGCTTGNNITLVPDTVGSNNFAGNLGIELEPTFQAAAFGTHAAGNYPAGPNALFATTAMPASSPGNAIYAFWITIKVGTTGSSLGMIGGPSGAFEWRINSAGHQELLVSSIASIGTGVATLTSGNRYTLAVAINGATGAWTMWTISGGTATVDASGTFGTTPVGFTTGVDRIGLANGGGDPFNGLILDAGYSTTAWTSTPLSLIAAFSQCNAGV